MTRNRNFDIFTESQKYIPGGVNSPVQSFSAVGTVPTIARKARECYLIDEYDNKYIDYIGGCGTQIMGHAWQPINEAIKEQLDDSIAFGLSTQKELELAKLIIELTGLEKVRLTNSEAEATSTAIRLARAYTNRNTIIKFEGCYHGNANEFLVNTGSALATQGISVSPGIPREVAQLTLNARYNDLESVKTLVEQHGKDVAAIIVEPVPGHSGVILPEPGFLEGLREITRKHKIILIFDEVLTGFRVALGGAQQLFNIEADLVCYGKIIGGGFPIGAIAGKSTILNKLAPNGKVYQVGSFEGNPITTTAGITVLEHLKNHPEIYQNLEQRASKLANGIRTALEQIGLNGTVNQVGSMLSFFFIDGEVKNHDDAKTANSHRFAHFFSRLLKRGVHLPPSSFESWFVSNTHTNEVIDLTLEAIYNALKEETKKVEYIDYNI